MMPISCFRGVARQPRVGVERDAVAHRRAGSSRSPTWTVKLVSVAPRSRRLNSSILPRLRSHPIHDVFARVPVPLAMEQEEAIGVLGAEPPVECLDARARGGEDRPRPPAASRASASAKSLRIAKWMRGSRLPSASTSRCSSSASTAATLVSSVGTTTIVRASSGMPLGEVEARQAARRDRPARPARCTSAIARSAGRDQQEQHQRPPARERTRPRAAA